MSPNINMKWKYRDQCESQLTFPSMPFIPSAASSKLAYLTKPNPLEYPDTRSVTTLATKP